MEKGRIFNLIGIGIIVIVIILVYSFLYPCSLNLFGHCESPPRFSNAWNIGCQMARERGCLQYDFDINGTPFTISKYDPDGDGIDNTIIDACKAVYGSDITAEQCWAACCGG